MVGTPITGSFTIENPPYKMDENWWYPYFGKPNFIPSGYLLHSHGKSPFLIGKPSINGSFPMATLNSKRVII
jgi:hypothetical protein